MGFFFEGAQQETSAEARQQGDRREMPQRTLRTNCCFLPHTVPQLFPRFQSDQGLFLSLERIETPYSVNDRVLNRRDILPILLQPSGDLVPSVNLSNPSWSSYLANQTLISSPPPHFQVARRTEAHR